MAQIFVLSGTDVGRSFEVADGARFGRHPDCQVVLRDRSISRRHARLELRGETWWLVDEGSRNGIFTADVRRAEIELADGAEFRCGELLLRFRSAEPLPLARADAPAAPPAPEIEIEIEDEIVLEGADDEDLVIPSLQPEPPRPKPKPKPAPNPAGARAGAPAAARPAASAPDRAASQQVRERVLQFHARENRGGLFAADLEQVPLWVRALGVLLGLALAAGLAWGGFRALTGLRERAQDRPAFEEEPVDAPPASR